MTDRLFDIPPRAYERDLDRALGELCGLPVESPIAMRHVITGRMRPILEGDFLWLFAKSRTKRPRLRRFQDYGWLNNFRVLF